MICSDVYKKWLASAWGGTVSIHSAAGGLHTNFFSAFDSNLIKNCCFPIFLRDTGRNMQESCCVSPNCNLLTPHVAGWLTWLIRIQEMLWFPVYVMQWIIYSLSVEQTCEWSGVFPSYWFGKQKELPVHSGNVCPRIKAFSCMYSLRFLTYLFVICFHT